MTPSPAPNETAPLSCSSLTFCTSQDVATYEGQTIPAATGGAVKDGLYRLSYTLSAAKGEGGRTGVTALVVRGSQFLRVGFGAHD